MPCRDLLQSAEWYRRDGDRITSKHLRAVFGGSRTGWEPEAATLDALRVSRRCHETEPNTSNAGGFAPNGLDCRRLGC